MLGSHCNARSYAAARLHHSFHPRVPSSAKSQFSCTSSSRRMSSKAGPISKDGFVVCKRRWRRPADPSCGSPSTKKARALKYRRHSLYDVGNTDNARSYKLTVLCKAKRSASSLKNPSSFTPSDDIPGSGMGLLR